MRIWHPIPPFCLDRFRLLGEHNELHAIWTILTEDRPAYRTHPEVKRWENHLDALFVRHQALAAELGRRGFNHKSPLDFEKYVNLNNLSFPDTCEPVETMRSKLAQKINDKEAFGKLSYGPTRRALGPTGAQPGP